MAEHSAETAIEKSLTQADCFADAFHDLLGNFVGAFCAVGKDVVDVRFVIQNFFAAFAHRRKILPQFIEELFFEIAVTSAAKIPASWNWVNRLRYAWLPAHD